MSNESDRIADKYMTRTMARKIILKQFGVYIERAEHVREVDDNFLPAGGAHGRVRDVRLDPSDGLDPADRFTLVFQALDAAVTHRAGEGRRCGSSGHCLDFWIGLWMLMG